MPADFRARVTVFGVQRSLTMLDSRLWLDDLGMWGLGVGVLCRNGSKVHIYLEHDTSSLLAVQGLSLIAAAMRRIYRWRCMLHTEGPPTFPKCPTDPLSTPHSLRAHDSQPWRCLTLGTWNVEGLTPWAHGSSLRLAVFCVRLDTILLRFRKHMKALHRT